MSEFSFTNAKQLLDETFTLDYFCGDKPAIPYVRDPGKGPLILVTGENAGGKSFFRRLLCAIAKKCAVEPIHISMEGRREIAYNIGLVFVYGDEQSEATGINSIRTVIGGVETSRNRNNKHIVVWDEPDIGLSDGNAASVGRAIAEYAEDAPAKAKAIVVVTHRKILAEQLVPLKPHYVYLGSPTGPETLEAWLAQKPVIRPLKEIQDESRARFLAIQQILNTLKKPRAR